METWTSIMNLSPWESLYKIEVEDISHFYVKEIGRMRRCGYNRVNLDKNLMLYIALNREGVLKTLSKENKKEYRPKTTLIVGEFDYAPIEVDVLPKEWVDSLDIGQDGALNYIN